MVKLLDRSIYLASRSPRRRELLGHIGVKFHLLLFRNRPGAAPDVDEVPQANENPRDYVMRMARAKAAAGWKRMLERNLPQAPVLAADTTVALEGRIFNKPLDRAEAVMMLSALSGKRHEVLTAVALQYDEEVETALSVSDVQFRELTPEEIRDYVATGESDDKAGAYAIQGRAALFVAEIRGSQSGIVGLPLYETAQLLQKMGGLRERRSPR
ncbi:MAG: Maf family nucleotide pyrophosphatase [Betaproteobacteria bacterium]|nr:Maf family nucleotide pyrophosphatase [Betaproteobacteria bacterium]MDH5578383.1 Maf family nucleotide pyrophosphatase [Betaproteobacteria bacterium]